MEDFPPSVHDVDVSADVDEELVLSSTSTITRPLAVVNEDNTAPVDFQVMSSDSDDEDKFDTISPTPGSSSFSDRVPCPLCSRRRTRLTCKECLRKGDFYVQNKSYKNTTRTDERYSELLTKFQSAQIRLNQLKNAASIYTEKKTRISIIIDEIIKCQNTIALQTSLKVQLVSRITAATKESNSLNNKSAEKLKLWPTFRKRLDNMSAQCGSNCNKLKRTHSQVTTSQDNLKKGTRSRIFQLRQHVFPLDELSPSNRGSGFKGLAADSWSDEEDDTVRSLMAAKSNVWSRPDELVSTFGSCYTITGGSGPSLPASGDYSAYNMWAERNATPSGVTTGGRNPAHCISAALTYTTQFVNLIAYYLDLRLPHRLSYSEFTTGDLSLGKFNRKLAKLNANVIHLCSSQGIHPTSLQPRTTISNLLLLFDSEQADLGRRGPFEMATQLAKSMEESIEKDLVIYEGDGGSGTDETEWIVPSDWETINRAAICEEFGFGFAEMKATNLPSPSRSYVDSSMGIGRSSSSGSLGGTGLLSSVTSFFRGWHK